MYALSLRRRPDNETLPFNHAECSSTQLNSNGKFSKKKVPLENIGIASVIYLDPLIFGADVH